MANVTIPASAPIPAFKDSRPVKKPAAEKANSNRKRLPQPSVNLPGLSSEAGPLPNTATPSTVNPSPNKRYEATPTRAPHFIAARIAHLFSRVFRRPTYDAHLTAPPV